MLHYGFRLDISDSFRKIQLVQLWTHTLPETNSEFTPENRGFPPWKFGDSGLGNQHLWRLLLVLGRVSQNPILPKYAVNSVLPTTIGGKTAHISDQDWIIGGYDVENHQAGKGSPPPKKKTHKALPPKAHLSSGNKTFGKDIPGNTDWLIRIPSW